MLYSMMKSDSQVEGQIAKLQETFYIEKPKHRFFKKQQKLECASMVVQNFDLNTLLGSSVYIIPNKSDIYIDYPKLKTFVCPSIYSQIIEYTTRLANTCIDKYDTFSLHVNMKSFSITAAQRYKDIIELFCTKCLQNGSHFQMHLHRIHLYHYPAIIPMLHTLFAQFIDDGARGKLVLEK
jgi:hypothetical protein